MYHAQLPSQWKWKNQEYDEKLTAPRDKQNNENRDSEGGCTKTQVGTGLGLVFRGLILVYCAHRKLLKVDEKMPLFPNEITVFCWERNKLIGHQNDAKKRCGNKDGLVSENGTSRWKKELTEFSSR